MRQFTYASERMRSELNRYFEGVCANYYTQRQGEREREREDRGSKRETSTLHIGFIFALTLVFKTYFL